MIKRIVLAAFIGLLVTFFAPPAWADSYTDTIAGQLSAGNRVAVDVNADPKLPNPDAINNQILQIGVPIWVVNIAKNQTNPDAKDDAALATGPIYDTLYAARNPITADIQVNGQPHKPPLILLVIDGTGYHAWSYDVNQSVADATGPNIKQAAAQHHGDLNGAVSAFVSAMAATPATGPIVSNVPPPPAPTNWAFAWGILWFFVAIIGLGLIYFFGRLVYRWRNNRVKLRDDVQDQINNVEADVNNLSEEVVFKGSTANITGITSSLADARRAFTRRNYAGARSHIGIAEREIDNAYSKLSPESPKRSHISAINDTHKSERKKAKIAATSPKGNRVTIKNSDYQTRSQTGYRNYYPGGTYDGVYFYPGYYPYPFWADGWSWSPTDVIIADSILNSSHTTSDYGFGYPTPPSGAGGISGHHSSGGSAGFNSSHRSSSSSHSNSSYSGSSSGGGSADFGGFSGGGFSGDSGGGGSAGF